VIAHAAKTKSQPNQSHQFRHRRQSPELITDLCRRAMGGESPRDALPGP
jgi:hypothetical protein